MFCDTFLGKSLYYLKKRMIRMLGITRQGILKVCEPSYNEAN